MHVSFITQALWGCPNGWFPPHLCYRYAYTLKWGKDKGPIEATSLPKRKIIIEQFRRKKKLIVDDHANKCLEFVGS